MVLLSNHPVPLEGIQHTEPNVTVNIEDSDIGTGTLYITDSCVLWLNPSDEGIQLEYRQINLHAISRDLHAFPQEHLLCHYEGKLPGFNRSNEESDESDNDQDSEPSMVEIRFIPLNKESLDAMFDALANCQTLHPDSDCQLSEEEDFEHGAGDGFFNSGEDIEHLTEEGRANLDRLNNLLLRGQGQGDEDISVQTHHLSIVNGHNHDEPDLEAESHQFNDGEQFQDADDMNE